MKGGSGEGQVRSHEGFSRRARKDGFPPSVINENEQFAIISITLYSHINYSVEKR